MLVHHWEEVQHPALPRCCSLHQLLTTVQEANKRISYGLQINSEKNDKTEMIEYIWADRRETETSVITIANQNEDKYHKEAL